TPAVQAGRFVSRLRTWLPERPRLGLESAGLVRHTGDLGSAGGRAPREGPLASPGLVGLRAAPARPPHEAHLDRIPFLVPTYPGAARHPCPDAPPGASAGAPARISSVARRAALRGVGGAQGRRRSPPPTAR